MGKLGKPSARDSVGGVASRLGVLLGAGGRGGGSATRGTRRSDAAKRPGNGGGESGVRSTQAQRKIAGPPSAGGGTGGRGPHAASGGSVGGLEILLFSGASTLPSAAWRPPFGFPEVLGGRRLSRRNNQSNTPSRPIARCAQRGCRRPVFARGNNFAASAIRVEHGGEAKWYGWLDGVHLRRGGGLGTAWICA